MPDSIYHALSTSRQDEIDTGVVLSEATVEGWTLAPVPIAVKAEENDTTILPQKTEILVEIGVKTITKTDGIDPEHSDAGDTVTFDVNITNTGNTRLNQVVLTDESITCNYDFSDAASGFLPLHPDGHQIACQASIQLSNVDVDAGSITGMAEVCWSKLTKTCPPPPSR